MVVSKPPSDRPSAPRTLLVIDVHDQIDPTTRAWITLDAEGNEMKVDAATARAGELGLRFEAWLLEHPEFTPEQRRLLNTIGEQIKANADALDAFELHHFVNPPFSYMGGLDRAALLFGGMDQLETMLTELNRAVFHTPADHGGDRREQPSAT